MAALTFYLVNGADAEGFADLSTSTQTAATTASGWTVGTGNTNNSELQTGSERAASTFVNTTPPDGSLDTSLKDAFRTPNPLTGDFASANWSFQFAFRAVSSATGQLGRVVFRLIKADADGSNATEITSGQQSASITGAFSTSVDCVSTLTFNPGAFSLNNQYLFIQIAFQRTTAASMTTADALFRTGSAATPTGTVITTSDFTLTVVGANVSTTQVNPPSTAYVVEGAGITGTQLFAPSAAYNIEGAIISGTALSSPTITTTYEIQGGTISTTTVNAPTLAHEISGATIAGTALYAPVITTAGGTLEVEIRDGNGSLIATRSLNPGGSFLTDVITLTDPERDSISNWNLRISLIADGDQIDVSWVQVETPAAAPAGADQDVTAGTISTTTLFPPSFAYAVTGDTISGTSVNPPTVAYAVGGATISETSVNPPSVAYGITVGTIAATVINAPSVSYVVTLGTISSTVISSPSLAYAITLGTISASQLYAPIASSGNDLVMSQGIGPSVVLYAPTVTPGAVTVTGASISTTALFAPSLAYAVTVSTIGTTVLFAPTLSVEDVVVTGSVSTTQLFAPTVAVGAVTVTGGFISVTSLFAPSLAYGVTAGTITSLTALYAPSLAYVVTTGFVSSTQLFPPLLGVQNEITAGTITSTAVFAPSRIRVVFPPSHQTTFGRLFYIPFEEYEFMVPAKKKLQERLSVDEPEEFEVK